MKIYGKTKVAMNTATCHKVLERLARSTWGKQGIGKIPNVTHAQILLAVKLVKPVEPARKIYALTLNGFRFLEHIRWAKKIKAVAAHPKRAICQKHPLGRLPKGKRLWEVAHLGCGYSVGEGCNCYCNASCESAARVAQEPKE